MDKIKTGKPLRILASDDYIVRSECAISILKSKLQIINSELSLASGRKVITSITGRTKTLDSTRMKLIKRQLALNFETAADKINDLVGVRAVCNFQDDIYRVKEVLLSHGDVELVQKKDYISKPKSSGYRSLHLIVKVPIYFVEGPQWIKAEVQLRTAAMNFWAELDHQLRYKKGHKEATLIGEELRKYSSDIAKVDKRMMELREKIEAM